MSKITWCAIAIAVLVGACSGQLLEQRLYLPDPYSGVELPLGVAWNSVNNRIYVGGFYGDRIAVIDGATNQKVGAIDCPYDNPGFCFNPLTNLMYFTFFPGPESAIGVIDCATNTLQGLIRVGNLPAGLFCHTGRNKIYCANQWDTVITVISGATSRVIGHIRTDFGPTILCLNPNLDKLYSINPYLPSVFVID